MLSCITFDVVYTERYGRGEIKRKEFQDFIDAEDFVKRMEYDEKDLTACEIQTFAERESGSYFNRQIIGRKVVV